MYDVNFLIVHYILYILGGGENSIESPSPRGIDILDRSTLARDPPAVVLSAQALVVIICRSADRPRFSYSSRAALLYR